MARMYKIERTIRPRQRAKELDFLAKIPWSKMQPGDCVMVPTADLAGHGPRVCRNIVYDVALQNGWRARTELTKDSLKIWRKQ